MAANVPLVESGTAGYFGQVQPIVKVRSPTYHTPNLSAANPAICALGLHRVL